MSLPKIFTLQTETGPHKVYHARNLGEHAAHLQQTQIRQHMKTIYKQAGKRWLGGDVEYCLKSAAFGDNALTESVKARFDLMQENISMETPRFETRRTVAGGFPVVPAVLSGNPLNMVVRRRLLSDLGSVALFCNMSTPAGTPLDVIERRGVALLSLAQALIKHRPVKLFFAHNSYSYGERKAAAFIEIDTMPIDIARAAWALVSPNCLRMSIFGGVYNDDVTFNCGMIPPSTQAYAAFAKYTGCDTVIQSPSLFNLDDENHAMASDANAAAWVRSMVDANIAE